MNLKRKIIIILSIWLCFSAFAVKSYAADFVKNQVLVKFKTEISLEAVKKIAEELHFKIIKRVSLPHLYLIETSDNTTIEEIMKRLSEYEEVEYCEPNYIYKSNERRLK